jgi:methylphosphotriester-DNA--protein-cysteine methyltransferase
LNPTHVIGGYREFAPSAEAAGFCESVWIHQTPDGPAPVGAAHRVLPEMGVSLAFQGFRDPDGCPRAWSPILTGPKLRAQVFDLVPGRELAAVKIKPEWAGPLLGIDPLAVESQVVDLVAVAPTLATRLHDVLAQTRGAEAALRVLMAAMLAAHRASRTPPSTVACVALDTVRRRAGRVSCERLALTLGLSDRHFRRHVRDSTGVPPKTYARLLRFVDAMRTADRSGHPAWADVAVSAGYFDQSHFIRDCVALAGTSPRALHAERRRQVIDDRAMSALSNPA